MSPGPVPVSSPPPGQGPTSSRSSQCVPLPRKPTGQEPQDQEPSGKLLHWAPGKQGLDKQPSAWEEAEQGQHRTRSGVSTGPRPSPSQKDAGAACIRRGSLQGN